MSSRHDVIIDGHYINSLRAQYGNETQAAAVRELVDNSVDANATLIEITLNGQDNEIIIEDDGDGCTDVGLFFNIGRSNKLGTGQIGRYGIGGTWASLYLCDTQYVYTTSRANGMRSVARMEWTAVAERGHAFKWELLSHRKARADERPGTRIVLQGIRRGNVESRHILQKQSIDRLRVLLGKTYGAAISTRCLVIGINGDVVDAAEPPAKVDGSPELELAGLWAGLPWRLRARHIHEGDDALWKPGVYVAYRGRLLNPDARPWTSGLGEHVGSPAWFWIELSDGTEARWNLNWDKSDFEGREEMLSEVLSNEVVRQFLRNVAERAQDIDSTLIGNDLSAMLNETLPLSRVLEKRPGTAGETGTVVPISSGIERRRAMVVDKKRPGTIEEERQRDVRTTSWKVVPRDLGAFGPLCSVEVSAVKRRTHGQIVSQQFHVTVTVNTFLPEQRARLRNRASAMALIAPSVAHKLAREHPDEFREIYRQMVSQHGEQDELYFTISHAERLAHVMMVRQTAADASNPALKKKGAR